MSQGGQAPQTAGGQLKLESVGCIGLGMMGHGIAKNICEKGYPVTVLDIRNQSAVEDMAKRGAMIAKNPREVAERSTVVFICVNNSLQVESIIRGPDGLKGTLKKGGVIVDCSTSDPTSTLMLAAELAPLGIELVDAAMGRTPKEAWEGTLDAMVGANDEVFSRVKPIIGAWAARIVHIGATGDGHKMKLLNNFLAMGYAAMYSEALALSVKVGISPERFDSAIRNGRMDCGFYQTFMQWILEGDRNAHKFSISNAFKDMRYLESMSDAVGLVNPMGNAIKNSYAIAVAAGGEADYVPMLATYIGKINGVDLTPKRPQSGKAGAGK
ncbi:MAG: NAD(P)-dependent oxidoreductase [Terriglobia bacterium]|jgi:3-hydroxyisobutyrate dehydrogenase-like beta-hydroxyacid dehydrogenase